MATMSKTPAQANKTASRPVPETKGKAKGYPRGAPAYDASSIYL